MKPRIYLLFVLLIAVTAFFRFNRNGQNLPEGCDVFGYLYMSEAISSGHLFDEHTERPFFGDLIDHLKSKGYNYKDYAWVVAPHAYHIEKNNEKIINQYPPGTSFLLSFLSKNQRQAWFSVLVILLMLILPGLAIHFTLPDQNRKEIAYSLLFILIAFGVISGPLLTEFIKVNSVAPTFGLLLCAGLVLEKRPMLAIFLVSLSAIFRIANVFLVPPIMIYAVLDNHHFSFKDIGLYAKRSIKAISVFIFSGFGIYLLYVYLLLGNPFFATYSEIDQRSIGLNVVLENISYYFFEEPAWFVMTVVSIALLTLLFIKKSISKSVFWTLISMPVIVYGFFLFHYIKTPYYPYAASMVIIGYLICALPEVFQRHWLKFRYLLILPLIVFAVMGIRESINYFDHDGPDLKNQELVYQESFINDDVIWAELKSSTVEYATRKSGMRVHWASQKVVKDVMRWLRDNGYSQAILVSDLNVEEGEIAGVLNSENLDYEKEINPVLGVIFRIYPDR